MGIVTLHIKLGELARNQLASDAGIDSVTDNSMTEDRVREHYRLALDKAKELQSVPDALKKSIDDAEQWLQYAH